MGGHQIDIGEVSSGRTAAPRSFLFLQGPISDFFDRLGRALIARGHHVHRINLHFGDQLFWRLPATHFRGHVDDWRGFIGEMLETHRVTDLVLHGDRRPYHIVAAEEGRARGIAVIATDLGYVRPDWITLERDGMSTYSRFPREPAAIRALAGRFPTPELAPRFHTPFWLISVLDVIYNLGLVFGRPLYPNYRYHGLSHPFAEYFGWVCSRAKRFLCQPAAARAKARLRTMPGAYFVYPLQLATDFQIRAHSPFVDARDALRQIITSFARSGSRRTLVIVGHPLDNGLIDWCGLARGLARQFGVRDRVVAFEGGIPGEILCHAAGIVTVNSTVGTTALGSGVPVKVLGNAVFDIPGLTSQQPLDLFWQEPSPPDPQLNEAFLRALIGTTQVKGGYYTRRAQGQAIAGFIERLEGGLYPLPSLGAAALAARPVRETVKTVVVAGFADETGLALARAYAAPGVRLCLIGAADRVSGAAADCRRRGASVDALGDEAWRTEELAARLKAWDDEQPIDVLAVQAGPDLGPAMAMVDALLEPLRRRHGAIVLIGARSPELLRYGRSLRQNLQPYGVAVSIAAPGVLAAQLAARSRHPEIAAIGADKAARRICWGVSRRRKAIALPGASAALLRTLRLSPSLLRDRLREALVIPAEPVADPIAEEPLPERSASGN
jgi:capsular polysaccharide export protein